MKERAVTFGPGQGMVGVLTEPDARSSAPHLLVLNAGFVHRVGPGRLSVEIARQVLGDGFATLRFDFSRIGDSPDRVPPLEPIPCGIADTREAMDHLCEAHGASKFILLGLCSGARHAHHIALADPRVVGAVMLDGYSYPTRRSALMDVGERLANPRALLAGAKRRLVRRISSVPPPPPREVEGDAFFPADPTREQMASDLGALAARNVGLLYIYTGEWRAYRYAGQLQDAFKEVPLGRVLTERMIGTADHLYFTRPERTAMLGMVKTWLRERYR